jgi:hypothetical protein
MIYSVSRVYSMLPKNIAGRGLRALMTSGAGQHQGA